mmetsp:Transcript_120254/g.218537  ORF Transcript_120254/g.218537 Transcript_120254/m.218537 type:complete len:547 (+) Transcript_120254:72-1712(+)
MSGFGERLSQRQKGFKKAADAEDARRKREDAAVQLRKQTREEALQKKRNTDEPGVTMPGAALASGSMPSNTNMQTSTAGLDSTTLQVIGSLAQTMMGDSSTPESQFQATQQLRKLLSVEQNPPIQETIGTGIVPRLVEFMKDINRTDLQFEAEWVLTNIASGTADQTRAVVEAGALPIFVQLLESPNDDVREQAVWALGNIAGDSANLRDLVLQSGGLNLIIKVLGEAKKISFTRNATWVLSNLCRGKPPPPLDWVLPALPTLSQLIQSTDVEVLTDACWAFSYITDGQNDRIEAVIKAGVCQRLVELLGHASHLVQTPALRALGNIVTGDDAQTQAVVSCGVLPHFLQLLSHQKKNIKKETCWAISNITAGNQSQIQDVINNGLIPPVIHLLKTAEFDIKREAAWVIANMTAAQVPQQIEYLVECDSIKLLLDLISLSDVKMISVALDALQNMLRVGLDQQQEKGLQENPIATILEQAEGLSKIEKLQEDPNEQVYSKAMKILEGFFPLEDDDDLYADTGSSKMNQDVSQFVNGVQVPQGGFMFS